MRVEIFKRLFHIQQEKIDVLLDFNEKVSILMKEYVNDLPYSFKEEFIEIAKEFIDKYNVLLGLEGEHGEETEEK